MNIAKSVFLWTLCGLILFGSFAFAENAKTIAVVTMVQGEAEYQKAGQNWKPLSFGLVLDDGDKLRTGTEGFIALVFTDDRTELKIRPNSDIVVTAQRNDDYSLNKRVSMEVGELFTNVSQQKGSMEVATPTSVAAVKGTQFWVMVNADGTTDVLTLEGIVDLMNLLSGLNMDVGQGQRGTSGADGDVGVGGYTAENLPQFINEAMPKTIEIEYTDEEGNVRTLIINYQDAGGEE